MLDLGIVAEDFFETAFEVLAQSGEGDDAQASAGLQARVRVVKEEGVEFVACFRGEIGDDTIELSVENQAEAVA